MPQGKGYWLEPQTGTLYEVETHDRWLLAPKNQVTVGLTPTQVRVLQSLDPVREIDEIRLCGCLAGLVRLRDNFRHVTVQFYCEPERIVEVLRAVAQAMPGVTGDKFPALIVQNLIDDSISRIHLTDLDAKLDAGEAVLQPSAEHIEYNIRLREKMDRLLRDAAD